LSIVKHVAASHGGTVAVWSVEGEGSTFTLRLPVRTDPAPDHVQLPEQASVAGVDPARGAPATPDVDAERPPEPGGSVVRQKEATR
jgi:two-component system sensor histidine kinase SenX3